MSDHVWKTALLWGSVKDCEDFLVQVTDLCVEQCNTNGKFLLSNEHTVAK